MLASEIIEDGALGDIVAGLGDDLDSLRLSQAQIKLFAKLHPDKLYPERLATFALFTREDEPVNEDLSNLFLASVGIRDLKLLVLVRRFLRDQVLDARTRPRFVVPQR